MYGAWLRSLRVSRGLTQGQLSDIVGIAAPNLSAYENDRQMPSFDVVNRIVNGLGYLLVLDAEAQGDLRPPLAKGGWTPVEEWPERDPDDPPETGKPIRHDAPMGLRLELIERALSIPEMVRGPA